MIQDLLHVSGGTILITLWTSVLGAFCRPHNHGQGMMSATTWPHAISIALVCMSWNQEVFARDTALV